MAMLLCMIEQIPENLTHKTHPLYTLYPPDNNNNNNNKKRQQQPSLGL